MNPCIPSTWPEYSLEWRVGRAVYRITVVNPERLCRGVASAELDGAPVDPREIPLADDDLTHQVTVLLGRSAPEARDAVGSRAFDHR